MRLWPAAWAAATLCLLTGCPGDGEPRIADPQGARVEHFTVDSRFVHRSLRSALVTPPGGGRGLLVFLHGRGGGARREDANLHAPFFSALRARGTAAPAVVFPNGGDHSYWHDRRGGRWGRYVLDEVVPEALRRTRARRVAIGGISMGGFGALDLARLRPRRFCAAGAHSPAIWQTGGETAPGAFDDAADFARHDFVRLAREAPERFRGLQLWIDAGRDDPFVPGIDAFLRALRAHGVRVATSRPPGGHDSDYWRSRWDDYLRFYARALARC